jgi:hypothetical protein
MRNVKQEWKKGTGEWNKKRKNSRREGADF